MVEGGVAGGGVAAGVGEVGVESAVVEEGRVEVADDVDLAVHALAEGVSAANGEAADVAGLEDDAEVSVAAAAVRRGEEVEGAGEAGGAGEVAAESAEEVDVVVVAEAAEDVAPGGEVPALARVAPSVGVDNLNVTTHLCLFPRSNMCKLLISSY